MKEKQIDALLENIELTLTNAKDIVESFEKLPPSEKEAQLQNLEQMKQQINTDILMFETMLNASKRKKALIGTKDDLTERQMAFETEVENLKKAYFKIEAPPAPEAPTNNNAMLIELGDQIGQEAVEKGEEVIEKLKKANQMLLDIEDEIYEQRLKLLRIKDNINESQSLMNRGKEVVDYFSKAMARDKFIRIAVGLMAILLIGTFAMMYLFNNSQKRRNDKIQSSELKDYEDRGIKMENGKIKIDMTAATNTQDYLLLMEEKFKDTAKQERLQQLKKQELEKAASQAEGGAKAGAKAGAPSAAKSVDTGADGKKEQKALKRMRKLSLSSLIGSSARSQRTHKRLF